MSDASDYPEIEYPFDGGPEFGTTRQVARSILWLRMPMSPPLGALNVYLIHETGGWAIIDTGLGDERTKSLWIRIHAEALGGEPFTRLILTHHHPDHAGLAAWLCERWGLPLFMSAREHGRLQACPWGELPDIEHRRALLRRAGMPEPLIDWRMGVRMSQDGHQALARYQCMADGDCLDIGGSSWQVVAGHGHTPESASLFCAERRILIAGDQALPRINASLDTWDGLQEESVLGQWLASAERLAKLPADTLVLPSHNEPYIGLGTRSRQMINYHEKLLDTAEQVCRDNRMTAFDLGRLVSRSEADHSRFLACGSAHAHLRELELRGRVRRALDADGFERWQACAVPAAHAAPP
jgi:glyoxylase-like metal-dependent hydrolase (beta-lactamase superfamily II)